MKRAPGDIVLLAGKGHENYQILADRTMEFDDRDQARRVLRQRGIRRGPGGPAAKGLAPDAHYSNAVAAFAAGAKVRSYP